MPTRNLYPILLALSILLSACAPAKNNNSKINIVASTTLIADAVARVAGDKVNLTVLYPAGTDPHSFEPRPQDAAALADADIVFLNGLGLEETLEPLLNNAKTVVEVSDGIHPLDSSEELNHPDPHVWQDPNNVIIWTKNIAAAFIQQDPANAAFYEANAKAYVNELIQLDAWIEGQVAQIAPERRLLVTEHKTFAYFAARYGFQQIGAILPANSAAAPSAQELAGIEDEMARLKVSAIFVGNTFSTAVAEQVAQDTGVRLIKLYSDSLSPAGGEAENYLSFMRYNVQAIVAALK